MCFQLPIAETVLDPIRPHTALALFPTKALAQDQLRSFLSMASSEPSCRKLAAATYDGDSSTEERRWVRGHANVLLTNPEMLHSGILPNHRRWSTWLSRLEIVVVDELHVLRGVFGTHVGHVLRRLRRVCDHYGASPTFVFCSATLGQPDRLARELCGLPVVAVTEDGSPQGPRRLALVDPPVIDALSGARVSTSSETAAVATELVRRGHRTIVFARSRKGTELIAADMGRRLPTGLSDLVRSYRGGYLPAERREIEQELADGRLRAVVATTALELGIDIGGLDACVLSSFPGTIASMWQQAGRAGRSQQESIAVLVAGDDQLDRWLVRHPEELTNRRPEPAVINPSNPFILDPHLACAAHEIPLRLGDERYWGDSLDDGVRRLVVDDQLRVRPGGRGPVATWAGRGVPAPRIGLRTGSAGEYRIVHTDGTLIGTVDDGRAHDLVHPGAVYLHRGRSYRVRELDLDVRRAVVEPDDGDEYTQTLSTINLQVLHADRSRRVGAATLWLGGVEVSSLVTGYQRREVRSSRIIAQESLDLPPSSLVTRAFWYTLPDALLEGAGIAPADIGGTLHAAEHAAIGVLPLFTICDRWDVGGVSIAHHPDTAEPTIFVYDGYPGGAGIAELGFEASRRHIGTTLEVIDGCPCADGCPSCVQSPKCGNGNEPLDKAGAARLLRTLLEDVDRSTPAEPADRPAPRDAVDRSTPLNLTPIGRPTTERDVTEVFPAAS